MSYISTCTKDNDVIVWERTDNGRSSKHYPAPFYFYIEDDNGEYTSIFGKKLLRLDFNSSFEFYDAKRKYDGKMVLYESDISSELKIISQHYYEKPAPKLHLTLHDIEVNYNDKIGFAGVANPYAPISAITLFHQWLDKYVVLVVPPTDDWTESKLKDNWKNNPKIPELPKNMEILLCKDEKELLLNYLSEIEDSDILCGWNSDFFDMPYIGKRIEQELGRVFFKKLSFKGGEEPKYRLVEKFGVSNTTLDLSGRISADYLALFQKYEAEGRRSYKLESIADEVLPDLPKLKYRGTLHSLYKNDFAFFVRYNIRDVEILWGFEQKLGYVALANEMYHLSGGLFKHVTGTLKLSDMATVNYCHHVLNVMVPDGPKHDEGKQFDPISGALVLDPKVGIHEWIAAIDISSLYPSSIRSLNISPEMLIGQFLETERASEAISKNEATILKLRYENGMEEEMGACDWKEIFLKRKWSVSGYGTVFNQEKEGIIPAILRTWYETRKKYQALKEKATNEKDKEKASYYDRLQYVFKIKLNSYYGALVNQYFRFFDLRMGESVTATGRVILRHQCSKVNEILTNDYNLAGEVIIYGDTDSTYFETWAENKEEAVKISDKVNELVNQSFPKLMKETFLCNQGFNNVIKAGREIVSDKGIFVDKKRYILHIVDKEGKACDKMKVMGLDTKRTTLPKEVSDKLNGFIERFLKGEKWEIISQEIVDYKEDLKNTSDIMRLGLPKGIKGVEDYYHQYLKRGNEVNLPGHVAASIHYNQCLEKYNDKESTSIKTGMKIKVFYLTQKYGRFKSIALPTDIEEIPNWFIDNFMVDREAHIERLVDNPLQNILTAIDKKVPSKQNLMVNELLEF